VTVCKGHTVARVAMDGAKQITAMQTGTVDAKT